MKVNGGESSFGGEWIWTFHRGPCAGELRLVLSAARPNASCLGTGDLQAKKRLDFDLQLRQFATLATQPKDLRTVNSHHTMLLEDQRYIHEDLERLEQGIADRMGEEPKHVCLALLPSSTVAFKRLTPRIRSAIA